MSTLEETKFVSKFTLHLDDDTQEEYLYYHSERLTLVDAITGVALRSESPRMLRRVVIEPLGRAETPTELAVFKALGASDLESDDDLTDQVEVGHGG